MFSKAVKLLLFLGFFSSSLVAQETLRGTVVEKHEDGPELPIPFANVYWLGTQVGASADSNGVFTIETTLTSKRLVISSVGFNSDTILVKNNKPLKVVLKPLQLDAVDVVYEKRATEISYLDPMKVENIGEKELCKAACCNLSESFETNPSVDAIYADAVTGTKQIQMLGLDGKYAQITRESMPDIRGLSTIQGLSYIPGTWIESIQLNKGAGSVVNGFESVTGQINVELKKPETADPLFVNAYVNQGGRTELNIDAAHRFNEKVSTLFLVHGDLRPVDIDGNDDGFLDFPTGHQLNLVNRWQISGKKGWNAQFGVRGIMEDRQGGEIVQSDEDTISRTPFGVNWKTNRLEVWSKVGHIFKRKKQRSIGFQASAIYHDYKSNFGQVAYDANQQSGYFNAIFQDQLLSEMHKYKIGVSAMYDQYDEQLDTRSFQRTEIVPGAFAEYTFNYKNRFTLLAGFRGDYHNYYGLFFTPRLHVRYEIKEGSVVRISGGKGSRTANVISDNQALLASARQWIVLGDSDVPGFGMEQEKAWNFGANFTQELRLNYRPATFSFDAYHTEFENQTVIDREDPTTLRIYNLDGRSFATSIQGQVDYSVYRGFDLRMAYRWYDVRTDYASGLLKAPFVAKHRAFINLSYETKSDWQFDATAQWQGQKRIPNTSSSPLPYQMDEYSPDLLLFNAQITKTWKDNLAIYMGMENITNVKQDNPIISSDNSSSEYFDSSMIWGPIFGRMTYLGIRWTPIKNKT